MPPPLVVGMAVPPALLVPLVVGMAVPLVVGMEVPTPPPTVDAGVLVVPEPPGEMAEGTVVPPPLFPGVGLP